MTGWIVGGIMLAIVLIPVGVYVAEEAMYEPSDQTLEDADYQFWVFSDPHNRPDGLTPIADAITDTTSGGGTGGAAFEWDIALVPGDWVGLQTCPSERDGRLIQQQLASSGVDPNRIYGAIGNHDGDPEYAWFQNWIDPLGHHTATSGISNARRPYAVQGAWDHYRFETEDFVFLVLGDRNGPGEPFGRDCAVPGGYPAGAVSRETFDWWVRQVEAANKPVVTVAHHALEDTTAYTRMYEGADNEIHSQPTAADHMGSSFIFGIGDAGFPDRDYGFVRYLEEHPGAIAMWIHGHTHARFSPGTSFKGNRDIEVKHGVVFLNSGAITTTHAAPKVPYSHIIQYFRAEQRLVITPYLHDVWEGNHAEGVYKEGQVTVRLGG